MCSSERGRIPFEHPDSNVKDCGAEDRLPRLSPHLKKAHMRQQIDQVNVVLLVLDNVSRKDAQGLLCARLRVAALVGGLERNMKALVAECFDQGCDKVTPFRQRNCTFHMCAYFPFYARGLVFVPCAMPSFPSWRQSMSLRPVNSLGRRNVFLLKLRTGTMSWLLCYVASGYSNAYVSSACQSNSRLDSLSVRGADATWLQRPALTRGNAYDRDASRRATATYYFEQAHDEVRT